jgi:hypothetical protein
MGSVVGGVLGYAASEDQIDAANQARKDALGQWTGLNAPSVASQQLSLQDLANAGNMVSQNEGNIGMDPTAMGNIQTDPRLQQAQMAALDQLSQMGQTGLTAGERAALNEARRGSAQEAQAKSAQITSDMARRGMGGSGSELAARLQAAQSSADRQSQQSDSTMQMAQQRALQAIGQQGSLAGQMNNQQFQQQADIAKAKDAINQFNTQNAQQVQQRNVAAANAAQLRNLQNQQSLNAVNTQTHNQQQQYNKGLIQQQFNNQTALAAGRSGQYQGIAQANQQQAGNTANMWAGIGKGVDTGAGSYFANQRTQDTPGMKTSSGYTTAGGDENQTEDIA